MTNAHPAEAVSALVYRSRSRIFLSSEQLIALEKNARVRNESMSITGMLLFDGTYFFQYLEGPEEAVQTLFLRILEDSRHHHIIKLLDDYAPARKFPHWGMQLLKVQSQSDETAEAMITRLVRDADLPAVDRAFKLMVAFASGRWLDHATEAYDQAEWTFELRPTPFAQAGPEIYSSKFCQFALQPIVDTSTGLISSLAALVRSPSGGTPQELFNTLRPDHLHIYDLKTKRHAFELAAAIGVGHTNLSINLLPASLTNNEYSVDWLVEQITEQGLKPQQLIIEITEEEAISHFNDFHAALKKLRSAGISVAIDDFGAGYAGLAMLAKFQPEKLKIDRQIVTNIHTDGPRQAIVKAIVECCSSLGISIVAEGVESFNEWSWLRAAGVNLFQGFFFAKPKLNGVDAVNWPVPSNSAAASANPQP